MANLVFPKARTSLLKADLDFDTMDTRIIPIDTASYTYSAADDFLDDVAGGAIKATAVALSSETVGTVAEGAFDAADLNITSVTGTVNGFAGNRRAVADTRREPRRGSGSSERNNDSANGHVPRQPTRRSPVQRRLHRRGQHRDRWPQHRRYTLALTTARTPRKQEDVMRIVATIFYFVAFAGLFFGGCP